MQYQNQHTVGPRLSSLNLLKDMIKPVLGKLPPALMLTLILNQTLTLTGGQFSSGAIFWTPLEPTKEKCDIVHFRFKRKKHFLQSTENPEDKIYRPVTSFG